MADTLVGHESDKGSLSSNFTSGTIIQGGGANGRISDYRAEKWLGELVKGFYIGLHHDNPDVAGAYASEVFGGGYARQVVQFTPPNNRAIFTLNALQWNGLPGVTITHLALWDALINGNYEAAIELEEPVRVLPGRSLGYPSGVIAFSLD